MDGGQNVSERLGFANMTKRVVPCNTLQDPKVEQVIRFLPRPQNVVFRSDRESESKDRNTQKDPITIKNLNQLC